MQLDYLNAGHGDHFPPPKHDVNIHQETTEHWFSFGDCCLAISECKPAQETGRDPRHVLFFLHGRFGQGATFCLAMARLASHFRCIHLDFPGFGRSFSVKGRGLSLLEQSGVVRNVIRRFLVQGKKAVLIGHDTGGAVAQLCAIREPETYSALVLINSASLTQPPQHFKTGIFCLRARRKLKLLLNTARKQMEPEHRQALLRAWDNRVRRSSMVYAFKALEYTWPGPFERQTWREQIRKLSKPVLLLWGRQDLINPPATAEELMRYLPEAYLFENEDCGHWPCLENADWVDTKMREFIFRLDSYF